MGCPRKWFHAAECAMNLMWSLADTYRNIVSAAQTITICVLNDGDAMFIT